MALLYLSYFIRLQDFKVALSLYFLVYKYCATELFRSSGRSVGYNLFIVSTYSILNVQ